MRIQVKHCRRVRKLGAWWLDSLSWERHERRNDSHCMPSESKHVLRTRVLSLSDIFSLVMRANIELPPLRNERRNLLNSWLRTREIDHDDDDDDYYWWKIVRSRACTMIRTLITLLHVGVREREEKRCRGNVSLTVSRTEMEWKQRIQEEKRCTADDRAWERTRRRKKWRSIKY